MNKITLQGLAENTEKDFQAWPNWIKNFLFILYFIAGCLVSFGLGMIYMFTLMIK